MTVSRYLFAVAALALSAGGALAAAPTTTQDTELGMILANADGMTLYTYDEDSEGKSMCYDDCATNWPPLMAEEGATPEGDYTVIERDDGSMQWAYDGMPLYLYADDEQPGDVKGDGANEKWHVVMAEQ